jgi:acyl-CoA reductase-like NAD-dependent aldehyde dehydrogenase
MLIDGDWVEARDGSTFEVYDPALGEVIAHVPAGDAEDVDLAVAAARRAFEDSDWSRMTASDRGRIIWRIGDVILEHADELAEIESLDNGKPVGSRAPPTSSWRPTCSTTWPDSRPRSTARRSRSRCPTRRARSSTPTR